MSLAGDPDALYVAYVYAPGYEPARVRWVPGTETRVELVPRDVEVRFEGLGGGERLRVNIAGRDSLVALSRITDATAVVSNLRKVTPGRALRLVVDDRRVRVDQ